MKVALVSHVNDDGDILEAWFKYYCSLGISSFHLIVHGPWEENRRLYALKDSYPVSIEDTYEGPFDSEEKKRRLDALLARLRRQWLLLADSDEFVEFPYRSIIATIRLTNMVGKNALFAPMLHHFTPNGSLDTPPVVQDPFRTFPLCSVDLYQRMGSKSDIRKFPLFYCTDQTSLGDGGNHNCPNGNIASSLQGVTHHFKFRSSVLQRLDNRIHSSHPWRHESVYLRDYLASNGNRLPTEGAFTCSRNELFRRGLLRRFTFATVVRRLRRAVSSHIPSRKDVLWP
jgi:hypothetical protein